MNKNILLKTTLTIFLLGILLLLILVQTLEPKKTNIKDISNKQLNKIVKITGQIINIKTFKESDFQILTIQDSTSKIQAVFNSNKQLNLKENQTITIIGKITDYKNNPQIQVEKILN